MWYGDVKRRPKTAGGSRLPPVISKKAAGVTPARPKSADGTSKRAKKARGAVPSRQATATSGGTERPHSATMMKMNFLL